MDRNEIIERLEKIEKHAVHTAGEIPFVMSIDDGIAVHEATEILKQKNGRWICSDDMFETAVCSCCGWDSGESVRYARENFNFCPNCGADMRGEQHDT